MNRRLKVIAARHALGLSTADELIDAAHAILDEGVYSFSLGELVTQAEREPSPHNTNRLFTSAMQELNVTLPTRGEGIAVLVDEAAESILERVESPSVAVRRLYSAYAGLGYIDELQTWAIYWYRVEEHLELRAAGFIADSPDEPDVEYDKLLDEIVQHARTCNRDRWRPVVQPAWLSSTVLALAAGIRDDRAFDRLPILADALQDVGCENEDILGHLRHAAKHDRTCWVVELLSEM